MKRHLVFLTVLMTFYPDVHAFDIGLVPLFEFSERQGRNYGKNISLQGNPTQIKKLRKWIGQIVQVPKGLDTLIRIQQSGHKLFIYQSTYSMVSSGRTSAPASSNLINGKGESVDILFNADIPDQGSHEVFGDRQIPIEYTAAQNLYHELAHALHMMQGTWRYFKSERQAIEEENIFRQQLAELQNQPYLERVYVSGRPICPDTPEEFDASWNQDLICLQD